MELPAYKGYTVDVRLREFRKVSYDAEGNPSMETITFESEEGDEMLFQLIRTLDRDSPLFQKIAESF